MRRGGAGINRKLTPFLLGLLTGALLFGGITAVAAGVAAEPSKHAIYVDGRQVPMAAYRIAGNNYVKLRDIGKALDVNVYWQNGVQIDSAAPYTGNPPTILDDVPVPGAASPAGETDMIRQDIIDRTNALRKSNGLPALETDPLLMAAAQVRADEMAATSIYSHIRPDGTRRTTVTDCPYTTENIHCVASGRVEDPERDLGQIAVEEWESSQDHRSGMLDKTRSSIGVGVAKGVSPVNGEPCWYCVQWFLRDGYEITWVDEPLIQR